MPPLLTRLDQRIGPSGCGTIGQLMQPTLSAPNDVIDIYRVNEIELHITGSRGTVYTT